ncbi:MAG: diphosphomevalonate decarboxylase [Gammaproteobacteria bacterium]|nr:diphosphomevalonate decarboxylase [Gammaproteobacteria bacterium]
MATLAQAHPNIALVKYWGKQDRPGNYPATPSLSITLNTLTTHTEVSDAPGSDEFFLDDEPRDDAKVTACLRALRTRYDIPPLCIRSTNNFPTAAGLASSASGFAALVCAIDAHCELKLDKAELSAQARLASGSAARSVFGGFVSLNGPDWTATELLGPDVWPLAIVIAITATKAKATSSSAGMRISAATSPFFDAWITSSEVDFRQGVEHVKKQDFASLAELAEHNCLKMHGLMMSSRPGLVYWNAATLSCIHVIRTLRADGLPVFFTIDAGPQVKAVCQPEVAATVAKALAETPGVLKTMTARLGGGARVLAGVPER